MGAIDVVAAYDKKYLKSRAYANSLRRRKARLAAIEKLGSKCSSPSCCWVNDDGSKGCTDVRVLQFDHINGGGTKERNDKNISFERLCKDVMCDDGTKFQLLCANCNWIKAFEKREFLFKYGAA